MNTKTIKIILSVLVVVFLVILFLKINNTSQLDKDDISEIKNNDTLENKDTNVVVLETTKGNIEIELYYDKAPITVNNFKEYVTSGFYDDLVFHRIIDGFMIQGGGFDTTGAKKQTNDPIIIESNNGLKNKVGTIAMARTMDPNSATSQFFINTVDNSFLDYSSSDPGYAVFGKVISGMDVVYNIEKVDTDSKDGHQNWPVEDIIIIKAYLK
jgi:cyclophilin family peptidyl-prolyl cis-trans isomerase